MLKFEHTKASQVTGNDEHKSSRVLGEEGKLLSHLTHLYPVSVFDFVFTSVHFFHRTCKIFLCITFIANTITSPPDNTNPARQNPLPIPKDTVTTDDEQARQPVRLGEG